MKKFKEILCEKSVATCKLRERYEEFKEVVRVVLVALASGTIFVSIFLFLNYWSFLTKGVYPKLTCENEMESAEKQDNSYALKEEAVQPVMYIVPVKVGKGKPIEQTEEISEEISYEYTEEEVKILGDAMFAEFGEVLSRLEESEAEYWLKLTGSVPIHRRNANWGGSTIHEIIFSGAYSENTRNAIGKEWLKTPDIVYKWAEELLKNGPIGPKNLIYQSQVEQGIPYDDLFGEYFGLEPSIMG